MAAPQIIVHFRSADGLSRYEKFGQARPPYMLRRVCWPRIGVFTGKETVPDSAIARQYEYRGIETLTQRRLVMLYQERL